NPIDFNALVCYTVSHSFLKNYENRIHIVSGFAKNNGRGAEVKSIAKHNKGGLPVLQERNFRRSFRKKALFSVCWGRGEYPLDCHFGGELSLVLSRRLRLRSIFVRM
ncbi:MAG: hypothetical protein IJA70_08035, partial [Oscillospiraceae bacterium]|nr:hypothetical protein [Oscillospiraceae bacterium]